MCIRNYEHLYRNAKQIFAGMQTCQTHTLAPQRSSVSTTYHNSDYLQPQNIPSCVPKWHFSDAINRGPFSRLMNSYRVTTLQLCPIQFVTAQSKMTRNPFVIRQCPICHGRPILWGLLFTRGPCNLQASYTVFGMSQWQIYMRTRLYEALNKVRGWKIGVLFY